MFAPPLAPKKGFAIDVLTTEYLVSGTMDADNNALFSLLMAGNFAPIVLTAAHIRPTGSAGLPDSLSAPWTVAYGDTLVAIIPRDPARIPTCP